jgi:hypothetical protein
MLARLGRRANADFYEQYGWREQIAAMADFLEREGCLAPWVPRVDRALKRLPLAEPPPEYEEEYVPEPEPETTGRIREPSRPGRATPQFRTVTGALGTYSGRMKRGQLVIAVLAAAAVAVVAHTRRGDRLNRRLPWAVPRRVALAFAPDSGGPGLAFAPDSGGPGLASPESGGPALASYLDSRSANGGGNRPNAPRSPGASAARTPCTADSGRPSENVRY